MKIQLLSVVVGTEICNARCPFCISKMTPLNGVTKKAPKVHWRNFDKALELSNRLQVTTAMLTGKGEPTLYPEQLSQYLKKIQAARIPIVELQTNATLFHKEKWREYLKEWYELGLTTIAISVVHYDDERNRAIYLPTEERYPPLVETVKYLKEIGYTVRLSCVLIDGYITSVDELLHFVAFAKQNEVDQLTLRPVNSPENARDTAVDRWISENYIRQPDYGAISDYIREHGAKLMTTMSGAEIYDLQGQNICLTDSLTIEPEGDKLRQLIFFPDGKLKYDWQYEGATLL